ncbi:MAG: DegV family protein [Lactobacillaceae bacterium]|jgi:DegV family protein with EDD domain|nr:DegV family protein [Lactobacillaceae bacterium]
MSKIAVLVDSSSNLTPAQLTEYNIFAVNAPIVVGDQVYHENESWATLPEFYDFQRTSETPLQTSQVEPGIWLAKFNEIAELGYTDVIVVSLSAGISGTFSTLQSLALTVENIQVTAWDSMIAAAGAGNQALLAAKLALADTPLDDIITALTELRESTKVLFVVDDIKHLQRTGRISGGTALVGSLLNIKPMLTFKDGKIEAIGKERQMKKAWAHIQADFAEVVANASKPIRVSIIDANNGGIADKWAEEITAAYPADQVIVERGPIGAFISVHTGEKAMGFIWGTDFNQI